MEHNDSRDELGSIREIDGSPVPRLDRPAEHPQWGLIGLVDGDDSPTDGSINHDHDIYGGSHYGQFFIDSNLGA
jgi:hypothetical protein